MECVKRFFFLIALFNELKELLDNRSIKYVVQHKARLYIVPEEILRGDVSESLLKVQTCLEILELISTVYEDRRANLNQYQKNCASVRPWDFSPLFVFSGLKQFMDRVETIKVSHQMD